MKSSLKKGLAVIVAASLGCTTGVVLPDKPKPHSHQARGIYVGLPELIALRYVYGWDKPCGFQANIGPIFGSADIRVNRKNFMGNVQGYGLIGVTTLMPWVKDYVTTEPGSPTHCIEFGAGFEKGREKGLAVGAEFALVMPLEEQKEEDSGTMGFRFGISLVQRY